MLRNLAHSRATADDPFPGIDRLPVGHWLANLSTAMSSHAATRRGATAATTGHATPQTALVRPSTSGIRRTSVRPLSASPIPWLTPSPSGQGWAGGRPQLDARQQRTPLPTNPSSPECVPAYSRSSSWHADAWCWPDRVARQRTAEASRAARRRSRPLRRVQRAVEHRRTPLRMSRRRLPAAG